MLYEIINDFPNELINLEKGPFISIYQPTHRAKPDSTQNPIRFKNLVQKIEKSLKEDHKGANIEAILKPLNQIAEDNLFWNESKEGLAVLANEDKCLVYRLPQTVEELAVVGDSFHIKPLIRVYQSADRYNILTLNKSSFKLYEGNRYGFEEIIIPEKTPTTLKEVLGDQYTESTFLSGGHNIHGLGGRKVEADKDTKKYFRYVDKFVTDNYSNINKLPLILVTLTENQGDFRELTHNNYLLEDGSNVDPESLNKDQLKEHVWKALEPLYIKKTEKLVDRFENSRAKFSGSDDIAEIVRSGVENKIDTVLLESGRIIKGSIKDDGRISEENTDSNTHEDLLDDIAELVFRNGGEVIMLPKERMPSTTGAAAIFRY